MHITPNTPDQNQPRGEQHADDQNQPRGDQHSEQPRSEKHSEPRGEQPHDKPRHEQPYPYKPAPHHSMNRRNPFFNYHSGGVGYMITLKIEEGATLLARLPKAWEVAAGRDMETVGAEEVVPILTPLGEAMREAWLSLPERFDNISIRDRRDEFVIMPEHFHGILFTTGYTERHLSEIEKVFKARVTMTYRRLLIEGRTTPVGQAREWLRAYQALSAEQQVAAREWVERQEALLLDGSLSSATRRAQQKELGPAPIRTAESGAHAKVGFLFAAGYNDKPFSDEETLGKKQHYILHNPIERVKRSANPDWLRPKRGGIATHLTVDATFGYLCRECQPREASAENLALIRSYLMLSPTQTRLSKEGVPYPTIDCDTYGNRELLDRTVHRLLPLVCHRRDSACYPQQRQAVLDAAQAGAVIVSACINPKENDLMKEIIAAGHKAIRIEDNGIPEVYHPSEERQNLCATGRYLIVTPWRYHYKRHDEKIFTAYCKTMNCLAQALCGCKDEWWKT